MPFGIYEQRQSGSYMVRVRCTAGIITPAQLNCLVANARALSSGRLHVTTRQELQIHDVTAANLIPLLRSLHRSGLSSRGGGGNTLRNVIAPADSGASSGRVFDVSPYACAVSNRLVQESESWSLPRKFKIAFSDSTEDLGHARISDLGFIAKIKDGERGFEVYVAGGLGARPALAKRFLDFVPANEVILISKAIRNLFSNSATGRIATPRD